MSIHDSNGVKATESVESTDGPSVMTKEEYVERRGPIAVDYGELVRRVATVRDLDAAEAKAHISRVGREKAFEEVRRYSAEGFTRRKSEEVCA